jgi:hypothetical protein
MLDRRQYIFPMLPLSFSEKEKLGEPKEEIGNLKMDLNTCILVISKYNTCNLNICILVILRYNLSNLNILRIHISYFRGQDTASAKYLCMVIVSRLLCTRLCPGDLCILICVEQYVFSNSAGTHIIGKVRHV